MKHLESFLNFLLDKFFWGWPLIGLLLIMSLYFAFKTRFFHIRFIHKSYTYMFEKNDDKSKISPFQALSLIIANQAGTGNIIGVAAAIYVGGPGAVFWMWITAIICSSLSFAENTLAQMYKSEIDGQYRGGPSYYILKGLKSPYVANFVSFMLLICLGLLMPTIQSSTIANSLYSNMNVPKYISAILLGINLVLIIIGNSKKIVTTATLVVPFMSFLYIGSTLVVLIFNINLLDDVIILILNNAFNQNAVFGSIIGQALSHGIRRGIFTHESGLGSTPNTSASGNVRHPIHQGLTSTFCVFIDTLVMCTLTAFIILTTNSYNIIDTSNDYLYLGLVGVKYEQFAQYALNTVFQDFGTLLVSLSLLLFGFMAIIGAFYNGETNILFIFKNNKKRKIAMKIYKVAFILLMIVFCFYETSTAWKYTDLAVGIATLINLLVLFLLRKEVFNCLNDYKNNLSNDKKRKYINNNLECWKKN